MRKIKIVLLENGVSGGGSFVGLVQLATHLDRERFDPIVVFVNQTTFLAELEQAGVATRLLQDPLYSTAAGKAPRFVLAKLRGRIDRYLPRLGPAFELVAHFPTVRTLAELMRQQNVDLLHLNDHCLRDFYGVIAARRLGIPAVSYLRSVRSGDPNRHKIAYLNRHVSHFVANSNFTRDYWATLGIDRDRTSMIYNAIDDAPVQPLDLRREWRIEGKERRIVGCVANFVAEKGQEHLLRAFPTVLAREPGCILALVGNGPQRVRAMALAERLGIRDSVLFPGYDARSRQIIASLDLLVLPSFREAFGRTLLEAMQVGTPILATRVGGIPEVIESGRDGILVERDDVEGLGEAVVRLLRDREFAAALATNARRRCAAEFGMTTHIAAIQDLYESLLAPEARRSPSH